MFLPTRFGPAVALFAAMLLPLAAEDFAGKNLTGRDFAGQRLLGADFSKAQLAGAKFRGTVLRGATFAGADLTRADFRQADVRGVSFQGARGLGSDPGALRNALYSSATIWPEGFAFKSSGASLIEEGSPVAAKTAPPSQPAPAASPARPDTAPGPAMDPRAKSGVDMKGQDLSNQNFVGKYLNGANFDATRINFTTFNRAELQGATFRAAEIVTGYFKEADLTGADFTGANIQRANFSGAKLNGAKLEGARLMLNGWSGHFAPPKLNPDFKYSYEMKEAMAMAGSDWMHNHNLSLKGANLRGARIAGNLETVDLRKSDLRGADLSETTNAEDRFLKDALYDSATVWWRGFDPAKAGAKKMEGNTTAPAQKVEMRPALAGKGIAGYFWRVSTPGVEGVRLLYIYPDGNYSWALGAGEYLDKTWKSGAGAEPVTLEAGPGGENWTASLASETGLLLRSASGRTLQAERGEATTK